MNYIVFYTKGCTPMIKEFKTFTAARKFADKHEKGNTFLHSDNWVDCIVKGTIVKTYPSWYDKDVQEK